MSAETLSSEPVTLTYYWPFFRVAYKDVKDLEGMEAHRLAPGIYSAWYPSGISRHFALQDGMETKPLDVVRVAVPCPKVRKGIPVRWESSHWQKLLKRGWVPA